MSMASCEDYVMRPVLEGLVAYDKLISGAIDLEDIARMNDALNVQNENERRAMKAAEKKRN